MSFSLAATTPKRKEIVVDKELNLNREITNVNGSGIGLASLCSGGTGMTIIWARN